MLGVRQKSDCTIAMMDENYAPFQINRLYQELLERGLKYFFPFATFKPIGSTAGVNDDIVDGNAETTVLSLTTFGSTYAFHNNVAFTEYGLRMVESVSAVLNARYRMLRDADRSGFDVERFGDCQRTDTFQRSWTHGPTRMNPGRIPTESQMLLRCCVPAL